MDFTEILNLYRKQLQENLFYRKKKEWISTTIKKKHFFMGFFFCKRYLVEIEVKYIASFRL